MTITPLGSEVDPLVYWRKTRSSGLIAGIFGTPPSPARRSATTSFSIDGTRSTRFHRRFWTRSEATRIFAPALARMRAVRPA